ncbi:hypothetical protein GV791_15450 [Nocardia cyriacigeorgica]|uniref:Uncharacterized protein n=1 Tax=Nocardia cyriacigeorgica TaxID=135487 RepID=A0A6P1CPX4_9NOCA|nr:hypothetical protein [Nocardia cyriacigeorgica]MBF6423589.1 hypothetical protein [Nocardia cyriacigeorgica]NEW33947.1 hypothetical protein [Nocardia cyriacigeorgica]
MSTILALHEGAQAILAQVGNPTPEAPPAADAGLQASRWGFWALVIGLPLAAIGVVAFVLVRVSNSDRRRVRAPHGWAAQGQPPGWDVPGPHSVPPPGPAPSGWNQQPGAWGPNGADTGQPGWDRPPLTTNPPGHR